MSPVRDPLALTKLPPRTRLSAPEFDAECAEVYVRALQALASDGVPHMLGGALGLNAYTGIWRDTKDLDVFVRPDDASRALAALERAGFETEVVYDSWLGKAWSGDVFVDLIWRNANALFPVTGDWFENARTRFVLGDEVLIIPPEELLLSKIMVGGRYRFDGADVLHVIHAAFEELDWARLADAAGEHVGLVLAYLHMYRWGYPGFRDRVPDDVIAAFEARAAAVGATSHYGPFRALLMDIQSYQVDVEGLGLPDPHKVALIDIYGSAEGRS